MGFNINNAVDYLLQLHNALSIWIASERRHCIGCVSLHVYGRPGL